MAGRNESEQKTYASTGVNYESLDPFKKLAQEYAKNTSANLERFHEMKVVEESRGESAFVWERGDHYGALVIEGLGTKNLVADEMRKITGKTYYDQIAQDAVAMIVNDLITVGAKPEVINAYFASGDSEWLGDLERSEDLLKGWKEACDLSGATWGGGETPTLKGIVSPNTGEILGAATGVIKPKERLVTGEKLSVGDRIFLVESSGIHANGLTLARSIAENLPEGYATKLSDGVFYGDSLLEPTFIYELLVESLLESGIDIHYMANITGHGWRKLMRANRNFTYVVDEIPKPQPVFEFIQEKSGNDDEEMYGNFNMGAGFAIFLEDRDVDDAKKIFREFTYKLLNAGYVKEGPRRVVIKPKDISFEGKSLDLR
jgi:phosphoribosylformylglycinamidine cyclo-ligase